MLKKEEQVVIDAAKRACSTLGLQYAGLDASESAGASNGSPLGLSFDACLQLIDLYVQLMRITGTEETARAWLHGHNDHLGYAPSDLLKTANGIEDVLNYLHAIP